MRRSALLVLGFCLSGCGLSHLTEGEPEPRQCGGRASGFCDGSSSALAFCDDFDETPEVPLEDRWSNLVITGTGAIDRDPDGGCNESAAVKATLEDASGCTYANLTLTRDDPFERVTLAADVLAGELGSGDGFTSNRAIAVYSEDGTDTECIHFLLMEPERTRIHTQRHTIFDDLTELSEVAPIGKWTRLEISLENVDGKARVSASVDGKLGYGPTLIEKCGAGQGFTARAGLFCSEHNVTWIDNVTIDVE